MSAPPLNPALFHLDEHHLWVMHCAEGPVPRAALRSVGDFLAKELLALGVCREQARCVLPLALYSEVYWTVSLQAVAHFIRLRADSHAQWEIQQYAAAVRSVVEPIYPVGLKVLLAAGKG